MRRIVNSLQESVSNANVDNVIIKIYCLCVYYSHIYFKRRIKWILVEKNSGPQTIEVIKLKQPYSEMPTFKNQMWVKCEFSDPASQLL